MPPIHYTSRTLANGLRVYAVRDPASSNVSVQVWYDVGSRDDPRGRSGFAHLFEHMMFKASRNLVPEQFDRLTEDVGGFNNASTNDDYTNYYEVVPANHLERLLWAEAERMGSLVVEPGFFASERDVVKEEYRSRVLAAPYGRMFYLYFPQISYDVLPYAPARHRQHRGSRRGDDRRTCAPSTPLITGPTMRCWSSPAISIRPSSTAGSTIISARSRGPPGAIPRVTADRAGARPRRATTPSTRRTRRCRRC